MFGDCFLCLSQTRSPTSISIKTTTPATEIPIFAPALKPDEPDDDGTEVGVASTVATAPDAVAV